MYPIKKIISIVPYFSGYDKSLAKREPATTENRLEQLQLTIKNLKRYIEDIYVFTCSEYDNKKIEQFNKNEYFETFNIDCNPIFLPYESATFAKKINFDIVYYTEADQILHSMIWDEIISTCNENNFLIPKRFIQHNNNEIKKQNKLNLGKKYNSKFLIEKDKFRAFGGAWLCSREFYEKIKFSRTQYMPIEHTSCFDLFSVQNSNALVAINSFDFWVDHLSNGSYYKKHAFSKIY